MKKKILATLLILLAAVGTAMAGGDIEFTASIDNPTLIYNGVEQTVTITANCSYNVTSGSVTGTNVGTYTVTAESSCTGHEDLADTPGSFIHTGSSTMTWVIEPRDIATTYSDGHDVTLAVKAPATEQGGVVSTKWTGSVINYSDLFTITFNSADLSTDEYEVHIFQGEAPTTMKDEGRYTIVFQGKNNFKGSIIKMVDVKKDMSEGESVTGIHFDIPAQILIDGATTFDFNATVTDKKSHVTLYEGTDYTLKFFTTEADATQELSEPDGDDTNNPTPTAETAINAQGKYWVVAEGLAPKYQGKVKQIFYVVNEYQTETDANSTEISLHITDPGYPVAETSPTQTVIKGKMEVGAATGAAIDVVSNKVTIPGTKTVSITEDINFDVIGIENNAFAGCTVLRWIDATALESFIPSSLERIVSGAPFYGVPKQSLVFLTGTTIEGTNYVYKVNTDKFFCEEYKVFDDMSGTQTEFSEPNGYNWFYENPQAFKAYKVTNTRMLSAGQHYTTCLPYDLTLPTDLKAYTLEASSDKLLGFVEVGTLSAFTPYVIIPTAGGQHLSIQATTDIPATTYTEATANALNATTATVGGHSMKGSMAFIGGANAQNLYIMQGKNATTGVCSWKQITADNGDYVTNKYCVLPMRAYIAAGGAPARLYATFNNADGSTTSISDLQVDADASAEIYDLQGRRVKSPVKGGLYIINGKKMIMK